MSSPRSRGARSLRILLLEDDPAEAERLAARMRRPSSILEWMCVEDEESFVRALDAGPDLIVSAGRLVGFDETRALEILRERGVDIPLIFVSEAAREDLPGRSNERDAGEAPIEGRPAPLGAAVDHALEWRRTRRAARPSADERRGTEEESRRIAERHAAILDALPAHVALVASDGEVVAVNQAWRGFAANNGFGPGDGVGSNYLEVAETSTGKGAELARNAAAGIRSVLEGRSAAFTMEYPCHSPSEKRWFRMIVTPFREEPAEGAVVTHVDITDRKMAEEALRESEARLRAIVEHEPECVKIVSVGGRLLDMNPAGLRMIESADGSEVFGRSVLNLIHPDDRKAFHELHRRASRGETGRLQFRILGANGTERWVESHSAPLRGPDGSILSVLSVTRDVTDRKRLEMIQAFEADVLEAISSGEALQTILERTVLGIERIVPESIGSLMLVDAERGRMSQGAAPRLPPDYARALEGGPIGPVAGPAGTAAHRRAPVIIPDLSDDPLCGEIRTVALASGLHACWAVPVLGIGGRVLAVVLVHHKEPRRPLPREIEFVEGATHLVRLALERDERERAVRQSEERFRLLARATNDAIWDWDLVTGHLWWNEGIETLFGFPRDQVEPTLEFWSERVHADDRDGVVSALNAAIENGAESWSAEYRFARSDGSYAWVLDRGYILRDASGTPIRMIGGMTDLTERKQLEQQFLRAQRMESIGTLAGGIAHDLNNLLQPITMGVEYLKRVTTDPRSHRIIDTIDRSARRGADLVRQVLSFARGVEGTRVSLDLRHVVREISSIVTSTFPRNVRLELRRPPELWTVQADPTQIHQVLINLCVNARDAMPHGGTLTLALANHVVDAADPATPPGLIPGRYVVIQVADTGTGMPPEVLERIFEPFFTTKEVGKGTGLGLSTVLGIVRSHGGFITVASEIDRGTTFTIHLPASDSAEADGRSETDAEAAPRGAGETVLIVDDEASILDITRQTLEAYGYRVLTAESGAQALALFAERRGEIDLMLTDLLMPGVDGRSLLAEVRLVDPGVALVASSGLGAERTAETSSSEERFLAKPYSADSLLRTIREALDAR